MFPGYICAIYVSCVLRDLIVSGAQVKPSRRHAHIELFMQKRKGEN